MSGDRDIVFWDEDDDMGAWNHHEETLYMMNDEYPENDEDEDEYYRRLHEANEEYERKSYDPN